MLNRAAMVAMEHELTAAPAHSCVRPKQKSRNLPSVDEVNVQAGSVQ